MIAAPVKTDKESSVISPLFGKAKFFATIDRDGNKKIIKNEFEGGVKVVRFLKSIGVTKLIVSHMGPRPFEELLRNGIDVYFAGDERILFVDAILQMADGDLQQITPANFKILIGEDEHHHGSDHSRKNDEVVKFHIESKSCCSNNKNKTAVLKN